VGAVGHFDFAIAGIWSATMFITPNNYGQAFAIDTVSFDAGGTTPNSVPAPILAAGLPGILAGLVVFLFARRRKDDVAAGEMLAA
jgi:hypothetical protein